MTAKIPWVSFCISTYKRPEILYNQLLLLSQQIFTDFEVIVSDNDPEASARIVIENMKDPRFRYFHNDENLGMIKSFNKSIERSSAAFIVMVTDDDPVSIDFLQTCYQLYQSYPDYSIYCGFNRHGKKVGAVEIINKEDFLIEILDPSKTSDILWSSAVVRKEDAYTAGLIPDYGSPHLADHAFIALAGSCKGGVVKNKMFSSLSSHDSNFSKFNFQYYISACAGFYATMLSGLKNHTKPDIYKRVISKHLGKWFIAFVFTLKKYYTLSKNYAVANTVDDCAVKILEFSFMKKFKLKYLIKNKIFAVKKTVGLLK